MPATAATTATTTCATCATCADDCADNRRHSLALCFETFTALHRWRVACNYSQQDANRDKSEEIFQIELALLNFFNTNK